MKISLQWLKEYIDFSLSLKELEEIFSQMGFPVEEVEEFEDGDLVFDLEITPNRPDCLSHYGVARELATFLNLELKEPKFDLEEDREIAEYDIEIEAPELCPKYVARIIKDINVKDSPQWLKEKLVKVGLQSINIVVDLSNYLLYAFGHPTHVFDMDRLKGGLRIRRARQGEKLLCLDEEEREFSKDDLVIADLEKPVAIAGVIGGEDTGVIFATKNVLIESAYFNPESIRRTARKFGISTDASYRFERGTDPLILEKISDILASLIQKYAGGRVLKGRVVRGDFREDRRINVSVDFVSERLGEKVPQDFVVSKLQRMGCSLSIQNGRLEITPPSWRRDLEIPEDIVEEIARLYGYSNLPSELPPVVFPQGLRTPVRDTRWKIREMLSNMGYFEAMTYIFTSEEKDKYSGGKGEPIRLTNPLNKEEPLLRRSVLLTLLDSISLNLRMGNSGVALFELGKSYWENKEGPVEEERLAIAETGVVQERTWNTHEWRGSFYSLKGTVEALFAQFGVKSRFSEAEHPLFEKGYCLKMEDAWLGVVNRELTKKCEIPGWVFAAEIPVKMFLRGKRESFRDVIKHPYVKRDISLLFPEGVKFSKIEEAIKATGISILHCFSLLDIYTGKGIKEGEKSLTLSLIFRAEDRTLRSEEVEQAVDEIVRKLEEKFGAKRRGV